MQRLNKKTVTYINTHTVVNVLNMCKKNMILVLKDDGGVGEVEPITKVINSTHTVWNFQKPAWNVVEF